MLRTMELPDYDRLISTMDDWWDGRRVHDKLPRLFVEHFRDTSLVIQEGDAIVGFLVGFASSSAPEEAYIHFVGVHPGHRRAGLARLMYEHFFAMARARVAPSCAASRRRATALPSPTTRRWVSRSRTATVRSMASLSTSTTTDQVSTGSGSCAPSRRKPVGATRDGSLTRPLPGERGPATGGGFATVGTGQVRRVTARFAPYGRRTRQAGRLDEGGYAMQMATSAPVAVHFDQPTDDADLLAARVGRTRFLVVPERPLFMIDGHGAPGGASFQAAFGALYPVAYTLHFALKRRGVTAKVGALEGLVLVRRRRRADHFWRVRRTGCQRLELALLLPVPAGRDTDEIESAFAEVARKKAPEALHLLRVERWAEGPRHRRSMSDPMPRRRPRSRRSMRRWPRLGCDLEAATTRSTSATRTVPRRNG